MLNLNFSKKDNEKSRVFWWEPKNGEHNAGDHLAKIIVKQMLTLKDKEILEKKTNKNKLLSIGSVMHFAKTGDSIWGTGINGKVNEALLRFSSLDVRAVRGPLTREFLLNRGIFVPEIYGDPGLLLPFFFSKELLTKDMECSKDFIVIPHMNEDFDDYKEYKEYVCSPRQGAISFTRNIVSSKFVISGSLHGVIIAEAYGIPAIFLDNNSGESRFKYDDYYYGSGRSHYPIAKSVKEALSMTPAETIDFKKVVLPLMSAFPYDLW
ncbi:polysaccharide pyruvyl transferase family protein [Serratia fonticola]|uniref:polysaccharide pyruvyl transferase family protein n=1 Tax=Serratia fonticola TaxID=47917 RepID=UPI00192C2C3E|nr:polysaccharide pyruvyl transferase family protein [Serratia fonticola]MBL5824660.1 polysaccharide pyruvyl transferase family protein [Serratia fonticola]